MGMIKCKHVDRELYITSGVISLKLCLQNLDILNNKYNAICDKNSSDLECLKCTLNFISVQVIDVTIYTY